MATALHTSQSQPQGAGSTWRHHLKRTLSRKNKDKSATSSPTSAGSVSPPTIFESDIKTTTLHYGEPSSPAYRQRASDRPLPYSSPNEWALAALEESAPQVPHTADCVSFPRRALQPVEEMAPACAIHSVNELAWARHGHRHGIRVSKSSNLFEYVKQPLNLPSRHSIDGSELSHPPSLKKEASNEPEQGITDEQLMSTYQGGDPWNSAAKDKRLVLFAGQWYIARITADNTPNIATLHKRIADAIGTPFKDHYDFANPNTSLAVIIVWNGKKHNYTTLQDDNLATALVHLEKEARYSWIQVVPSKMRRKTAVPTVAHCEPLQQQEATFGTLQRTPGSASSPDSGKMIDTKLQHMLLSAWESFMKE